jgi:hypothetical protein
MNDTEFIQIVNLTASQNGCIITKLDFDNHIIEIDGPNEDTQVKCAIALENILGRYMNE